MYKQRSSILGDMSKEISEHVGSQSFQPYGVHHHPDLFLSLKDTGFNLGKQHMFMNWTHAVSCRICSWRDATCQWAPTRFWCVRLFKAFQSNLGHLGCHTAVDIGCELGEGYSVPWEKNVFPTTFLQNAETEWEHLSWNHAPMLAKLRKVCKAASVVHMMQTSKLEWVSCTATRSSLVDSAIRFIGLSNGPALRLICVHWHISQINNELCHILPQKSKASLSGCRFLGGW